MSAAATFIVEAAMVFGGIVLMSLIWLAGYTTGHREGRAEGEDETWDRLDGPLLPPRETDE